MFSIKRLLATASIVAVTGGAAVLSAGAAGAATAAPAHQWHHAKSATAVTHVVSRHDSGGNGSWAVDKFVRTVTVTRVGKAGPGVYVYRAVLKDRGKFVTIAHAYTPNQGTPFTGWKIRGVVKGTLSGKAVFTFTASAPYPNSKLVPRFVHGDTPATSAWPTLFFPSTTTFTNQAMPYWAWTYNAKTGFMRHWVDASYNSAGQVPAAGNITGRHHHH
jgi:hypothetical protein